MAITSVPTLAGIASTVIFAWSVLPMLVKAHRTRDLASYSPGNLLPANVGNAMHSVYVFSLPAGPIWALHSFYLATSGLMLIWWLRYGWRLPRSTQNHPKGWFTRSSTTATTSTYCGTGSRDALSQGDRLTVLVMQRRRPGQSHLRNLTQHELADADDPKLDRKFSGRAEGSPAAGG
jgi:hypothetical protein